MAAGFCTLVPSVLADQLIYDDLIVTGSECIGNDCVNGESFGFDTLRLKENNLRIKFQDTSSTASFPSNDWQITANDSTNGGKNKFSIDDIDGGRTPFTIEASAPTDSLYVEDSGEIGLGTDTPVVEIHVVDGNTPSLRLEQDGSSGFTAQTWDIAGNEANFFIRDATNGSELPFRIEPGADSNSLYVDSDNDIGLGTNSPGGNLHVLAGGSSITSLSEGQREVIVQNNANTTDEAGVAIVSGSAGTSRILLGDSSDPTVGSIVYSNTDDDLTFSANGTESVTITSAGNVGIGTASPNYSLTVNGQADISSGVIRKSGNVFFKSTGSETMLGPAGSGIITFHNSSVMTTGDETVRIDSSGNVGIGTTSPSGKLDVNGAIYQRGSSLHADYVFEPDYELETIADHAASMWKNKHLPAVEGAKRDEDGQDVIEVGSRTRGMLEELEKAHIYIEQLHTRLEKEEKRNAELESRLTRIEALLSAEDEEAGDKGQESRD